MGYEQMQNNRAYIAGRVISAPVFSHEVLGEKFFDMVIAVKRLSDHEDEIPVTVSDRLMRDASLDVGDAVGVSGQLRSYNKQAEGRSKLVLRVFARELDDGVCDTPNRIELEGYVCKPPVYRVTPFKREICDMLLAVNRAYNKSDYIPCIAWGRNARFADSLAVGDKVELTGRIQSREYKKTDVSGAEIIRTAYEISVNRLSYAGEEEEAEY